MSAARPVGYIHPNDIDFLRHCIAEDMFGTVEVSSKPLQRREPIYLHPTPSKPPATDDLLGPTRKALRSAAASLAAAISLLERGGKKAAPSDKMFDTMLNDYRKSLATARAALSPSSGNESMGEKP